MEHTRLVARLLGEVATARVTITASYLRLWRSETGAPGDPGVAEPGPEPRAEKAPDSMSDERSCDDVSSRRLSVTMLGRPSRCARGERTRSGRVSTRGRQR